jgi:ATP-binding cassette subfamily B protein
MNILLSEYVRIVWQRKGAFFLIVFAITCATILDTSIPLFYKNLANGLTQGYSESTLQILLDNFSYIAISYSLIWLSWRGLEFGMIPLLAGGIKDLEVRCFAVLMQQKQGFFEDNFSGSLIKQASRFVSAYESIMEWIIFQLLQNLLAIIVALVIFYQQQPLFALYFLIWVVLFLAWSIGFSLWKLKYDKAVAEYSSKVGAVYSDAIANIAVVKNFVLEQKEQKNTAVAAKNAYKKRHTAWILTFISFAVQGLLVMGIELILVYAMIQAWKKGQFNVGDYVLFQSILMLLIHRLWDFGRNFRLVFNAIADANEMSHVFSQADIETDQPQAISQRIQQGQIEFKAIDFSYGNNRPLFKNFNLHIAAGEHIAFVGQSGSGKTSLVKLLLRFADMQSGHICFDEIDHNQFTLASLRKQMSLVPQQPELFHRSIRDNITLGKKMSEQRLHTIAKQAQCLDFIQQLPEQFETLVGERGVKLSGGEKQRIAIARAFVDDAPIVILDEATSALDSLTEQKIQTAISELIKNKTAIVIAHRLSTVLSMDRIIVLDKGQIIEQGQHHSLLKDQGKYAEMWQHQSGFSRINTVPTAKSDNANR